MLVVRNIIKNSVCHIFSCSFECYKSHKASEQCLVEPSATDKDEALDTNITESASKILPPFSTDDTVEPAKLTALGRLSIMNL